MSYCPSPSRATVNLPAILSNLALVRERAGDRQVLFAVKADAYGHGAVQVARAVQNHRAADWFAVATVAEAQELVDAGIGLPILKLSPADPQDLDDAIATGARLTVADLDNVANAESAAARHDATVRVHVAVDTGMGRIGLPPDRLIEMVTAVDRSPHLELEGVFTHLPISDVPDGREFTVTEIHEFLDAAKDLELQRGPIPFVHLANSGAILRHELGASTLVRAGIVGYGYDPDPDAPLVGLKPALSWTSRISFLKTVHAGATVGYGRTWTASEDTMVATVPVGYADGYPRLLSNRGQVIIGGVKYPIIGRVCMDQLMVDLGRNTQAAVGDEVVLIGHQGESSITADDLAQLTGTISYEITCDISKRVDRKWLSAPWCPADSHAAESVAI